MKKEYTSPSMQVVELKSKQILMVSGDPVLRITRKSEAPAEIEEYDGDFD